MLGSTVTRFSRASNFHSATSRSTQPTNANSEAKQRQFSSRSSKSGSRSWDEADEEEQSTYRQRRDLPAKPKPLTAEALQGRSTLSILSPLNRQALTLGKDAVIVWTGAETTGARYSSWPLANSCRHIPPGAAAPRYQVKTISGDPVSDIPLLWNEVRSTVTGRQRRARSTAARPRGEMQWLVKVGDELIPEKPFLKVGPVTFYHQPKYKEPLITPPLYVARFLLTAEAVADLPPGTPLLLAVHDLAHMSRYEHFEPSQQLLNTLTNATFEPEPYSRL